MSLVTFSFARPTDTTSKRHPQGEIAHHRPSPPDHFKSIRLAPTRTVARARTGRAAVTHNIVGQERARFGSVGVRRRKQDAMEFAFRHILCSMSSEEVFQCRCQLPAIGEQACSTVIVGGEGAS
jgi:hypothetical protein